MANPIESPDARPMFSGVPAGKYALGRDEPGVVEDIG